jgi:hypothetical protein
MNGRIRELARDSGLSISQAYSAEFNKFAELIVRECIANCNDLESMQYIADHFGIKIQGLNSKE